MGVFSTWWDRTADKIWNIGKALVPGIASLEMLRALLADWWGGIMDDFKAKVAAQLGTLMVDLAPSTEVASLISKANVVVPLSEMWHYLLLYLAIASTVLGVKWARNLIPGIS